MKRQGFVGTITIGENVIPIRSQQLFDAFEANNALIGRLQKALVASREECATLKESRDALHARRWVRIGRWLHLLRVP